MLASDIPSKLPLPFGASAGGAYIRAIPVNSQIGIDDGAASLTDGFVPLNATPIGAGGIPPSIKDMNGILYAVSGWSRWVAAGGPVYFDGTFASAIGGYPKGSMVQSATTPGVFWVSTADGNTTNPEGGSPANWTRAVPASASDAEALAASLTTKFLTPANLAALRASSAEILDGSILNKFMTPQRFYGARADAGAAKTGTDDHKYLTPKSLGDNFTSGQLLFPGGIVVQYGTYTASLAEGVYTRSLNQPMPTSVDTVIVCPINSDGGLGTNRDVFAQWKPTPGVLTSFQFVVQQVDSGTSLGGVSWVAFGR